MSRFCHQTVRVLLIALSSVLFLAFGCDRTSGGDEAGNNPVAEQCAAFWIVIPDTSVCVPPCPCDKREHVCDAKGWDSLRQRPGYCPCDDDCLDWLGRHNKAIDLIIDGPSCREDKFCDTECRTMLGNGSYDPDCKMNDLAYLFCDCDFHWGICEPDERGSSRPCHCDRDCKSSSPCWPDSHCDRWCPAGLDPDCEVAQAYWVNSVTSSMYQSPYQSPSSTFSSSVPSYSSPPTSPPPPAAPLPVYTPPRPPIETYKPHPALDSWIQWNRNNTNWGY